MSARTWIAIGIIGLFGAGGAAGQLQPGQALVTCFSDNQPNGPVAALYNVADPIGQGAPLGGVPLWPSAQNTLHLNRNLFSGDEVFGIALDDASPSPNAYLTSTAIYRSTFSNGNTITLAQNSPGTGRVFKVSGSNATGPVTIIATLPQDSSKPAGQGLGNIAFSSKFLQLYVTDFHDGKVHRLTTSGQTLGAYDPFQQFGTYSNTSGGFAPLGERLWGVGVFRDRLYFALWGTDLGSSVTPNGIFSIALDAFGAPVGVLRDEHIPTSRPVADIEFASDGRMLLAERSMRTVAGQEAYTWAHQSQLFEYALDPTGAWIPSGHVFGVGEPAVVPKSAAGGADYVCPLGRTGELVAATGDALKFPFPGNLGNPRTYGFQLMPSTGGSQPNSYLVDLDGLTGFNDKLQIGDIDVYNTCDRHCSELTSVKITCATDAHGNPIPGKYTMTFQIKNLSADTVYNAFLVGLTGASTTHFTFPTGLAPGALSPVLTTMISGGTAGQQLTFQVTLHDLELNECCATRHTITLPQCDCAQVLGQKGPYCLLKPFGSYSYSFTLQNLDLSANPAFVIVVPQSPSTATISPAVSAFTPNTQSVPLTIGNVSGGQQVCFLVSLHTADFERCCSIRQCITVPKCFDGPWWPIDDTIVTLFDEGLVLEDSGGDPGATLILPEGTTAFDVSWSPEDAANLAVGGTLEQSVTGTLDGSAAETVARLVTTRTATGAELRASFPASGATRHRFEFYLDGERTGVVEGVGTEVPAICNGCGVKIPTDAHFFFLLRSLISVFTFDLPSRLGIDGSSLLEADEVRVSPEDGDTRVDSLTSATVQAHGLPSLTLVDFRTDTDCDGNGLQDFEEIANGSGLDLDRNGLLDLCEGVLIPLAIDLSTGTEGGQALPGGSEDEDWTFVSPGPVQAARVVAQPNGGWASAFPGSRWISVEPETGRSLPGVRFLHFERTFCLTEEAKNLVLDLALRADDRASVRLNGQTLAGPGGGFSETLPPLTVQRAGAAGDGLFLVGSNRLEVEVRDPGGIVTGFDLAGSLTGPAGACSEP